MLVTSLQKHFAALEALIKVATLNSTLNLTNSINTSKHERKTNLLKQPCHFSLFLQVFKMFHRDMFHRTRTQVFHITSAMLYQVSTEQVYHVRNKIIYIWSWLCDADIKMYPLINHTL